MKQNVFLPDIRRLVRKLLVIEYICKSIFISLDNSFPVVDLEPELYSRVMDLFKIYNYLHLSMKQKQNQGHKEQIGCQGGGWGWKGFELGVWDQQMQTGIWVLATQSCPTLYDPMDCRPLCPWNSPGKKTGVGCHFLLQGTFPTQGSNLGLPHCRQTLY